jgi:hypothetical protein
LANIKKIAISPDEAQENIELVLGEIESLEATLD